MKLPTSKMNYLLQNYESIQRKILFSELPIKTMQSAAFQFRVIKPPVFKTLDYFNIFSQLPAGPTRGSRSTGNRFSGMKLNNEPGISGQYWGTVSGIAAEDFFYNVVNKSDPIIDQPMSASDVVRIINVGKRLPYYAQEGVPDFLPFMGTHETNIIVARTVTSFDCLDLNINSSTFKKWSERLTKSMRNELNELELPDVKGAIYHPTFREFARLLSLTAHSNGIEAINATSARTDCINVPGFDADTANTLVLLGRDSAPTTDKLVGTSVIKISGDPKVSPVPTGTITSFSEITNKVERGLVVSSPKTESEA